MYTTRTTNRLPFNDLSHERYEDLCLNLVKRLQPWKDIDHFGKCGSDDGIDIRAVSETDKTLWYIQCKRCRKFSFFELKEVVDSIKNKNSKLPDTLLVIVSCDVSKNNIEKYKFYTQAEGIKEPLVWTVSVLEAELCQYPDLLGLFFDIKPSRSSKSLIKHKLEIKKKFEKDFTERYSGSSYDLVNNPRLIFKYKTVIIRDIEDKIYPEADFETNIAGWFKADLYDYDQDYLKVILEINSILLNDQNNWDLVSYEDVEGEYQSKDPREDKYYEDKAYVVGLIPFENIIDYDLTPEAYYGKVTIYCNFIYPNPYVNKVPFPKVQYYLICEDTRDILLAHDMRMNLP